MALPAELALLFFSYLVFDNKSLVDTSSTIVVVVVVFAAVNVVNVVVVCC